MTNKLNNHKEPIAAFIFARGGSKGVLNKNIKELSGKPLIAYSIMSALDNDLIDEVFVSTDSEEIATISKEYGATVPFIRPSEYSQDNSPELLAWKHAIDFMESRNNLPSIMISLPTTSPFRSDEDITACLDKIITTDFDVVITITENNRHPMFNIVKELKEGQFELFNNENKKIFRRQDTPTAYDITTVAYAFRTQFIKNNDSLFDGKVGAIHIPRERALDIDTEFDFKLASLVMDDNQKY